MGNNNIKQSFSITSLLHHSKTISIQNRSQKMSMLLFYSNDQSIIKIKALFYRSKYYFEMRYLLLSLAFAFMLLSCSNEKAAQLPDKLLGMNIQYKYANDREYNVKLEEDGLSYRYASGSKPDKWWGKFTYHHAVLENKNHVVSWHEVDYDDYITLIIDFERKTLFGSGIIKGEEVHFQPAVITNINFE